MNTAQIIYEQYKVLPQKVREELKALILSEGEDTHSLTLMQEMEESLKEVKEIKEGKRAARTFADLKKEMDNAK